MFAAVDLDAAHDVCRNLTSRSSKTFFLASRFLGHEKRRAIRAVYAFCRTADDIVDRDAPARERLGALDEWEAELRAALRGDVCGGVMAAFLDAVRRFGVPLGPAFALLRGARTDLTVSRYATYFELLHYCDLVASAVGLLTLPILGCRDWRAVEHAVALGRAMQMTNILRDVGEDARMGRIYLPLVEMTRFGYDEPSLFAGRIDEAFRNLMRFQIARVRGLYAQAEPGIALLEEDGRRAVRLAARLYRGILDRIEQNGYDVLTMRAVRRS
jgi:phytoene synthase